MSIKFTPEDLIAGYSDATPELKDVADKVFDILMEGDYIRKATNMECLCEAAKAMDYAAISEFLDRLSVRAWLIGTHGDMYNDGMPENQDEWTMWLKREVDTSESFTPVRRRKTESVL